MKKTFGLFATAMLLLGGVAFAEQATLIDFTLLDADCVYDEKAEKNIKPRYTLINGTYLMP